MIVRRLLFLPCTTLCLLTYINVQHVVNGYVSSDPVVADLVGPRPDLRGRRPANNVETSYGHPPSSDKPNSQRRHLRRMEDAEEESDEDGEEENSEDAEENENDDVGDDNNDDTYNDVNNDQDGYSIYYDDMYNDDNNDAFSNIKEKFYQVETVAQGKFYEIYNSPPSEWGADQWGFFSAIMTLIAFKCLCFFYYCCMKPCGEEYYDPRDDPGQYYQSYEPFTGVAVVDHDGIRKNRQQNAPPIQTRGRTREREYSYSDDSSVSTEESSVDRRGSSRYHTKNTSHGNLT